MTPIAFGHDHGATAMEEDLSRSCCRRPGCPDFGKRGHGNLTVRGHYGETQQFRLLDSRTCEGRFSGRKGPPLYRSGLPPEEAVAVVEHLADRTGVRAAARLVGVNRNTVVRCSRLLGEHARGLHDELVAFPPSDARGPAR
jgi:transposase-like protein